MEVRRLQEPAELEAFREAYKEMSGGAPPLEYLHQAKVYGAFDNSRLIGGYAVNTQPPWRYIGVLPEEERPYWQEALVGRRVVEITCLWAADEVRRTWRTVVLWLHAIRAARAGDTLFYGTTKERLADDYREALKPWKVYLGKLDFEGVESPWRVGLARRPGLRALVVLVRIKLRQALRGRR